MNLKVYDDVFIAHVNIPFGELQTMIDWCDRNCVGEWGYKDVYEVHEVSTNIWKPINLYQFHFLDEKDYFAFTMWKK
jgi:hypothetical protein